MSQTVITANRLLDGAVVYLAADGTWTEQLSGAAVARNESERDALLAAANRDADAGSVIGPYAFAVRAQAGDVLPLGCREVLRTLGPSVRTDLGYQAEQR